MRGRADDVLRLVIDAQVDVRDESAERGGARDELPVDPADVRLVRVRRHHDIDVVAEPVDDRDDVAAEVVAAVGVLIAERERCVLEPALMDEHHERPHALLRPQLGDEVVDRGDLGPELEPRDAGRRHDQRGALRVSPITSK